MRVRPGDLDGVFVFEPEPQVDRRGFFTRTFDADAFRAAGLDPDALVQDSQSRSYRGVVRGLHVRTDGGEGKLVRCARGAVYDVAVDLRPTSPTFLRWQALDLDDVSHRSVWWPAGLAHGFQALSVETDVCYRIDRAFRPGVGGTLRWDDPALAIPWPLPPGEMSSADSDAPTLSQIRENFADWFGAR